MTDRIFEEELKKRTKIFGLRVVRLFQTLQSNPEAQNIREQLLRASTPIVCEYCAVCRTKSAAEFAVIIDIVLKEISESLFWLEMLEKTNMVKAGLLTSLIVEAAELTAILTTIRKSSQRKKQLSNSQTL